MTLQEIKDAIASEQTVYWGNKSYTIVKDKYDQYFIKHTGGHCIGLTWQDGVTMNGNEEQFFTGESERVGLAQD